MHQVLARKWRPTRFEELVGQPAVVQALSNAFAQNRLHHAYLLTGTRGVGKTTIGRILARCFNCESGPTATPCGECPSCVEIAAGRHVDLIEVDAASRTKVDDTRELLENAQYAPVSGRFKIYLIDEVHMLSEKSFNSLLKTLEEPPEHVKFILATTDPQKLPITVISRCLQFALSPMAPAVIQARLAEVLAGESIDAEPAALARIAEAAQGSMRDALSLTEQAIAFGAGKITDAQVSEMLGFLPRERVTALLDAVFSRDAAALLAHLADLRKQGPDWTRVLADAADLCYLLALVQAGGRPAPATVLPTRAQAVRAWLDARATSTDASVLQLCYQILIEGARDLPLAPSEAVGAEMTFLRALAFWPVTPSSPSDAGASPDGRPDGTAFETGPSPRSADPDAAGVPRAPDATGQATGSRAEAPVGVDAMRRTLPADATASAFDDDGRVASESGPSAGDGARAAGVGVASGDRNGKPSAVPGAPSAHPGPEVVRRWPEWAASLPPGPLREIGMNSSVRWLDAARPGEPAILELGVTAAVVALLTPERERRLLAAIAPKVTEVAAGRSWVSQVVEAGESDATPSARRTAQEREHRAYVEALVRRAPLVRALQAQGFAVQAVDVDAPLMATS